MNEHARGPKTWRRDLSPDTWLANPSDVCQRRPETSAVQSLTKRRAHRSPCRRCRGIFLSRESLCAASVPAVPAGPRVMIVSHPQALRERAWGDDCVTPAGAMRKGLG
eukprot:2172711-Pyramimonas_sp.AAC.1